MSGRTMIGGPIENNGFDSKEQYEAAVERVSAQMEPGRTFTVLGPNHPDVIEVNGEQYAKLPEGWPAAEAKDLEEAHAEAVANEEPQDWEDQIRDVYASFTPEEIQELCEDWVRLAKENIALRKGMKTMQRKTRKQAQQQRRLERRLAQARSGREQLRATANRLADRKLEDAVASLAELIEEKGLVVRGEPQASSMIDFDGLAKEPRGFA